MIIAVIDTGINLQFKEFKNVDIIPLNIDNSNVSIKAWYGYNWRNYKTQ